MTDTVERSRPLMKNGKDLQPTTANAELDIPSPSTTGSSLVLADESMIGSISPGESDLHDRAFFDPVAAASLVISNWERSVHATIDACVHVHDALFNFRNEPDQLRVFKAKLVEARIISIGDESLGSASKLSKLARIGGHAELLRDERILHLLEPGYSVLYEVVLLFETFFEECESSEVAIDKLAARLALIVQSQGGLRRQDVDAEKKAARRTPPRVSPATEAGGSSVSSKDFNGNPDADQQVDDAPLPGFLLITPRASDMRILGQDYAEPGTLARCLRVDSFGQPDRAIVITTISDLATVRTRLLPLFGLNTLSHAILMEQPDHPDILNARVAVIADRRAAPKSSASPLRNWLPKECVADPIAIAERFWDGLTDKAHLFAAKATDGWQCSIGDSAWKEKPSL